MSCSEELRRFFLAGIGAMATTAEKSKEIVDAFVRKGELTVEQGRIINEELKRDVKKTVSQAEDTVKRHVEIAVDSDAPGPEKPFGAIGADEPGGAGASAEQACRNGEKG